MNIPVVRSFPCINNSITYFKITDYYADPTQKAVLTEIYQVKSIFFKGEHH